MTNFCVKYMKAAESCTPSRKKEEKITSKFTDGLQIDGHSEFRMWNPACMVTQHYSHNLKPPTQAQKEEVHYKNKNQQTLRHLRSKTVNLQLQPSFQTAGGPSALSKMKKTSKEPAVTFMDHNVYMSTGKIYYNLINYKVIILLSNFTFIQRVLRRCSGECWVYKVYDFNTKVGTPCPICGRVEAAETLEEKGLFFRYWLKFVLNIPETQPMIFDLSIPPLCYFCLEVKKNKQKTAA